MIADEGTLRRLKKLLAIAADSRAAPAEAQAAMAQAQRIMAKFGVTELDAESSQIGEQDVLSTSHVKPPAWEGALVGVIDKAFGCKALWCTSGWKGAMQRARWKFIGLRHNLELASYTFSVLQRQALRARAEFVATLPEWYTRPQKAAQADSFCEGFVANVSRKVYAIALSDVQRKAIEKKLNDETTSEARQDFRGGNGGGDAIRAGYEAGEKAQLHKPMPHTQERKTLK